MDKECIELIESKELLKATVQDAVAEIFYYGRKNDDEFPKEKLDKLLESGWVSKKEVVKWFEEEIDKNEIFFLGNED